MSTPRPMSAATATALLKDILKWKIGYQAHYQTVQAIRYDDTTPPPTGSTPLPFPVDTVREDGAHGIETPAGIEQWLELWASWLSWALDEPTATAGGPWLLSTLEAHPALNPLPQPDPEDEDDWTMVFLEEWDLFTQELRAVWHHTGTRTGHAPKRRGLCPKCKAGTLLSPAHQDGYADEATCTNPDCRTKIDYNEEEVSASVRAAMRDPNINPDYYLPIDDIKTIWPRIKPGTLRKWAARGHIRKRDTLYSLADINTRMWK